MKNLLVEVCWSGHVRSTVIAVVLALNVVFSGCGDDGEGGGAQGPVETVPVPATPTPTPNAIQSGTLISLKDGLIEGEIDGATRRFLGIPYAAPPVGDLRWRPPQPPLPWGGVRPATQFGGRCAQLPSMTSLASTNEDCLYLNVWTPEPAPTQPLPVMVWIHGGGNQDGSASDPVPFGLGGLFYDGRGLVELADVVVVTLNYRLGVLGFFAHSALKAEDPAWPYAGNQGLQDQQAALRWVHENIRAFGGDPDNVTIFGESAGSWDVCLHMVSPASRGLFHRAISQSGGCTTFQKTALTAEAEAEVFTAAVGCGNAANVLDCLRALSVEELLIEAPVDGAAEGDLAGGEMYRGGKPRWSFNAVVDGAVIPDQPRYLFDSGAFAQVPYMLGSNTDEGTLFHFDALPATTEEEYLAALQRAFGNHAEAVAGHYPAAAFASPNDALIRVTGDSFLVCPTYDTARRAAAGGSEVFLYNFDRPVPIPMLATLGATHGAEIAYVFGSYRRPLPEDLALSEVMRGYWGRFAWNGNPNGDDAFFWPPFDVASDRRLNFNLDLSVLSDFRRVECEFWNALYELEFESQAAAPAGG